MCEGEGKGEEGGGASEAVSRCDSDPGRRVEWSWWSEVPSLVSLPLNVALFSSRGFSVDVTLHEHQTRPVGVDLAPKMQCFQSGTARCSLGFLCVLH
jgi:hypothetical protein